MTTPAPPGQGTAAPAGTAPASAAPPGFGAVLWYFLKLGTSGFGGPIAVAGYMQRDLVEQRDWIATDDFLNGVALGQTMPGPLAAQVAMWTGHLTLNRHEAADGEVDAVGDELPGTGGQCAA